VQARKRIRLGAAVALGLIGLFAAAELVARGMLDGPSLEARGREALAGTGLELHVGDAYFSVLRGSLVVRDIRMAHDTTDTTAAAGSAALRELTIPLVELSGVSPLSLFSDLILARRLVVREPDVRVMRRLNGTNPAAHDSTRSVQGEARAAGEARDAHGGLQVRAVLVEDADVTLERRATLRFPSLELRSATLRTAAMRVDAAWMADPLRALGSSEPEFSVDSISGVSADSFYTFATGRLHVSADDARLRVEGIRLQPTLDDAAFARRLEWRDERFEIALAALRADALDLQGLLEDGSIVMRSLHFDSLDLDVFTDKNVPADPAGGEPWLPNTLVREFRGRLRVDTIRVQGEVRYSELRQGGARRARLAFEQLDATLTSISNDSARMSTSEPFLMAVNARLFGAPLQLDLRIPLLQPRFAMRYRGSVGRVDLTRLNDLTIPLAGFEVRSGTLSSLYFDVDVDGAVARGEVAGTYSDARIGFVDRRSGDGDIIQDIKSFIANSFVIEADNPEDGEPARTGRVQYTVQPRDAFFKRLWVPLRTGLVSLFGL
jgi:hypothetical protein